MFSARFNLRLGHGWMYAATVFAIIGISLLIMGSFVLAVKGFRAPRSTPYSPVSGSPRNSVTRLDGGGQYVKLPPHGNNANVNNRGFAKRKELSPETKQLLKKVIHSLKTKLLYINVNKV